MAGRPDPRPARRIVNREALPFDMKPVLVGRCPLCSQIRHNLSRHHVVPRSHGGDDVAQNLVWTCGDGNLGCHGVLTHRNRDGASGLTFDRVACALLSYIAVDLPQVAAYAAHKKYAGWLNSYYGDPKETTASAR